MSKKRANGEGSIRKRKDGRWEGRYTAGYDKDGKVITKNVLGKTQAEVKEKLKTAIEESQKLDPTRTGQYTVQTWVTLWYEVFIKPQIRPNTKQFYRNCMENHLFPALGDCPLEKLSTIQIQRAINEMSEHGRNHYYSHIPLKETTLSPRIVQGILGILRKSLDQAVAEKLILSNPAANCKAPKTVRKEMKVLPEELIGPYLHEAKQRGVFAPLYLELTSGIAGPALERSEREGPNAFRHQKRLPHRPSACCQPAENKKLAAAADTSGEHRADSGGRTRKAPG